MVIPEEVAPLLELFRGLLALCRQTSAVNAIGKNIPYFMGDVTKRAPPECGIEYAVSGWTSLTQTKLIPAGVS